MQECFKCGRSLPLDEFYRHSAMANGHLGKCKDCTKLDVKANRLAKIDYYRAYDSARASLPQRGALRRVMTRRERERHPERQRVRIASRRKSPLPPHSCSVCGLSSGKVERHHMNYESPDNFVWVCKPCHYKLDQQRRLDEALRG